MDRKDLKIGIFGGTFDPIHTGHIMCAQTIFNTLGLKKIYFVVAAKPNFKQHKQIASATDRLAMLKLALLDYGNKNFIPSDIEIKRDGVSYTSDTLKMFRSKYKNLYFLCSFDVAIHIDKWHEPNQVFKLAQVVSTPRKSDKGFDMSKIDSRIKILNGDIPSVSSTEIRNHKKFDYVAKPVQDYIKSHHLYGY